MSNRYNGQNDGYDSYEDEYEDRYYGSRLNRSSYSDGRASGRSSGQSSRSDRRLTQGSDARYGDSANAYDDYYSDDLDAYRRSAYGSSTGSSSSRRSAASSRSGSTRATASQSRPNSRNSGSVTPRKSAGASGRDARSSHASRDARDVRDARDARSSYVSEVDARSAARSGTFRPASHAAATRGSASNPAPKRSNRKRNITIAVVVVVLVVLVGVGSAWAFISTIDSNLHAGVTQEALDALEPATEGEITQTSLAEAPFYMLLMGVDMGEARRQEAEYANDEYGRTDSMMLVRIDPINKKVSIISIHRDTMIDLEGYGQQKINAAYEFYGPAGAIQAVSNLAGVPISHYATVDFDGFMAIVDTIGGVEVNVPMEINDEVIPCHIDAGWQTLDGYTALMLCRSRHSYDDVADDGDVMRAANQRMVISAVVKKILASDLVTIANSVSTLSQYVTTDLALSDIVGLAQIFKDVDPAADIYTAMEPTTSAYIDDIWYEYLDEDAWREMIARMDQGLPPVNKNEVDDATGTILSTGGLDAPNV